LEIVYSVVATIWSLKQSQVWHRLWSAYCRLQADHHSFYVVIHRRKMFGMLSLRRRGAAPRKIAPFYFSGEMGLSVATGPGRPAARCTRPKSARLFSAAYGAKFCTMLLCLDLLTSPDVLRIGCCPSECGKKCRLITCPNWHIFRTFETSV